MSQESVQRILDELGRGHAMRALAESRELARYYPADEAILSLQATCAFHAGELTEAKSLLADLVSRFPGTWQHWNNLGNLERVIGDTLRARDAYECALRLCPEATRVRANLGLLLLNDGEFVAAAEMLRGVVQSGDAEPSMRIWAAVASQAVGDSALVDSLLSGWQEWPRDSDESMLELAWLLAERGDTETALSMLTTIHSMPELAIRAAARRVLLLERTNRLEQARSALSELPEEIGTLGIAARQELLNARACIAMREQRWDDARCDLKAALDNAKVRRGRADLFFSMARVLDRLGETAEALRNLEEAHNLLRRPVRAPDAPKSGWLAWLVECSSSGLEASAQSSSPLADAPVFVLGFPRSGTTLLEQMLSAHPALASMDERPLIFDAIRTLRARELSYPDGLPKLAPGLVENMRASYWLAAEQYVKRKRSQRLVDKNPLNMLLLPMILRLFPRARVIKCVRHPCDAILSCHFQSFVDPEIANLSASLPSLADSYAAFDRRFKSDAYALRAEVLVLRYEDLILETDASLARIGAYLDLSEVGAMKNYAARARERGFISTPSYTQVVEPLSRDSIGRWHRYETILRPLLPSLRESLNDGCYEC